LAQPFTLAVRVLLWQGVKLGEDSTCSISLAESFLQQLQESGVLQHLAAAMSHTTHRIWELQSQAGSDTLSADLADPAYNHKQVFGPSSSSLQQLHLQAGQLCACVKSLQMQLAAFNRRSDSVCRHELLQPVAVPALELSVLTVQHVSTCLELLPKRLVSPPWSLWRALSFARDAIKQYGVWCCAKCSCCAGLHQQLLQSPYYLPADCIALLAAVYGTLLCNDARAWWEAAANSSSGSGSGSSSGSGSGSGQQQGDPDQKLQALWEQTAWELACSRHDALPASHYLLLQLAGCSSKALLWAATDGYEFADEDLSTAALIHHSEAHRKHLFARMEQDLTSPDLVPETSAALLRHSVLLHWAWHYWQGNQGPEQRVRVLQLLLVSSTCLQSVVTERADQANRKQQRELQQQEQQMQQSPQFQNVTLSQAPSGLFFPAPVYLQILDDMLLLVHRLLTLLLSEAAEQQPPAQASSSSSSSVSRGQSSRPSQASSSGPSPQVLNETPTALLTTGRQGLLETYSVLSSSILTEFAGLEPPLHTSAPPASLICCSEAPTLREDAAVWFQHATQICQVLESYARTAARSQTSGSVEANCPVLAGAIELGACVVELIDPTQHGLHGPLLRAASAAGPGSKEQQQLLGLLRSTTKWAGTMGPEQQGLAEQLRVAVAVAAANMLLAASRSKETAIPAAAPGAKADTAAEAATTVLHHVPWLGVLGCCYLQWGQQLGRLPTDSPAAAAAAAAESHLLRYPKGVISVLPGHLRSVWGITVEGGIRGGYPLVLLCVQAILQWFAYEGNLPELNAQSCSNVEAIIGSVFLGCFRTWQAVRDAAQEQPVPLAGYVQQLSALGEALCSFAHKQSCNNPTCSNVSGPSELQLVKGRSNTCSGCRTARYCSPECMRQHWKQHRPICKDLARTAAAVAAAAKATAGPGS
jgi:hypothetical protein